MINLSLQKPKKLKANTNIKQTREQKYEIPEQERQEYEREKYERMKCERLENERTQNVYLVFQTYPSAGSWTFVL